MNLRNISMLTAVLAVIGSILWIAQRSQSPLTESDLVGQGLLESEKIAQAATIQVFEANADSPAVEVIKKGENWIVTEHYGLPVDFTLVADLISDLADSKIIRAVTDNPDRIAALNIGETRVVFRDSNSEVLADIAYGKAGSTQGHFAKIDRSEKVVLAEEKPFIRTRPDDWSVDSAWEFDWDSVTKIEDGALVFEREDTESEFNATEGIDIDQANLESKFSRLTQMRFQDILEANNEDVVEAMKFAKTWSITLDSGSQYIFKIGRRPEVKAPAVEEVEGDEDTPEEASEDVPAGTAYVILEHADADDIWKGILEACAFEITSFNFEQLPESLSDFIIEAEEATEEETES